MGSDRRGRIGRLPLRSVRTLGDLDTALTTLKGKGYGPEARVEFQLVVIDPNAPEDPPPATR